jgi:glycosyltransferase involved in cell wall biosynthesis
MLAAILIIILAFGNGIMFGLLQSKLAYAVLFFGLFTIFNNLRVVRGRMNATYMHRVTLRSWLFLIMWQLVSLGLIVLYEIVGFNRIQVLQVISIGSAFACVFLLWSAQRHIAAVQRPDSTKHFTDHELPTITVAIPARNETEDLEACLSSLIDSNYPKLEILVLDDCSQSRKTPEIIRQFAHDGVRFIAGTVAPKTWVAKNHAYQQLREEASGDYILFCGVDVRFSTESIRAIITEMLVRDKRMISIMPMNTLPKKSAVESYILQPIRYAWELALPRKRISPSVLSTCWVVKSSFLEEIGGFSAVARTISPEVYVARKAVADKDGYSFMASSPLMGLVCNKQVKEQRATAIRTRYPQLHRRPESLSLQIVAEYFVLLSPLILLTYGLIISNYLIIITAAIGYCAGTLFFFSITRITYRTRIWRSLVLYPLAIVYDMWLQVYSMWQYEMNDVIWKDRNVCVPVMHVEPHLPPLH